MSNIEIDLDAIAPRPFKVDIDGKTITVDAPTTRNLLKGALLIDILDQAVTMLDLEDAFNNVVEFFGTIIELEHELSIYQYKQLFYKMQEASVPSDSKALEEAGISVVDDGEKKDESSTLEK